jgi:NO-binding membrane sensor protein with MHYT domain/two-component sensor histidine kinase
MWFHPPVETLLGRFVQHMTPLAAVYDPLLVVLSIAVAILASYTALDLAGRFGTVRGLAGAIFLAASALTMGGGIWSMHFIGMLAFSIATPVRYDLWLTLLSLALPIIVTGIGFHAARSRGISVRTLLTGGSLMGGGIVLMHYTGMAAMEMDAQITYQPALVAASVVIAVAAATAALWLAFRIRATWQKVAAAVAMGTAISGMHYTAMAAAHFHVLPADQARSGVVLDPARLAIVIAAASTTVLTIMLLWSISDRRRFAAARPDGAAYRAPGRAVFAAAAPALTPRAGLLLLVLFFGTAVGVAWGIAAWTDYDETINRARVMTRNTAQVLEEHVKRTIGEVDVVLQIVKRHAQADGFANSDAWRHPLLETITEAVQLGPVIVVDSNGRVALNTQQLPVGTDVSARPYFRVHSEQQDAGLVISETMPGIVTGRSLMTLSRRIGGPDGSFRGVVAAAIFTDYFASFYRTLELGENASVTLFRTDGAIILREPPADTASGASSALFTRLLPEAAAGTYEQRSVIDQVDRILSYRKVEGYPLVIVTTTARATALEDWRYRLYRNAALALAVFAAVVWLSWLALAGIQREEVARAALHAANQELDRRVQERTKQLETALGEKETLLREVHHRVKNNLQMIQALVRMTALRAPNESQTYFGDITRRIWAIGQVHNQVYGSPELGEIDLAEYLSRLADNVATGFADDLSRIHLRQDFAPLTVDLDTALPVGLMVVELLTNAFKHAFADGRAGEIHLRLAAQDGTATLVVRDNGIGLPAQRGGASMGLSLVEALVRQIDGQLQTEAAGGAHFTLTFPLRGRPRHETRPVRQAAS